MDVMGLTNKTRAVLAGSSHSLCRLWPRPPLFATLPSPPLSQSLSTPRRTDIFEASPRTSKQRTQIVGCPPRRARERRCGVHFCHWIELVGAKYAAVDARQAPSFSHAQQVGLNHHRVTTNSHFLSDAKSWNGRGGKMVFCPFVPSLFCCLL